MPVFLSLLRRLLQGDHDITQHYRVVVRVYLVAVVVAKRERKHVCFAVDVAVLPVQFAYSFVVHQGNGYLGGVVDSLFFKGGGGAYFYQVLYVLGGAIFSCSLLRKVIIFMRSSCFRGRVSCPAPAC